MWAESKRLYDGERKVRRLPLRQTFCIGPDGTGQNKAGMETVVEAGRAIGLDADHADSGAGLLQGNGNAAQQISAARWNCSQSEAKRGSGALHRGDHVPHRRTQQHADATQAVAACPSRFPFNRNESRTQINGNPESLKSRHALD
jgi:hypothetical protein